MVVEVEEGKERREGERVKMWCGGRKGDEKRREGSGGEESEGIWRIVKWKWIQKE